MRPVQEGPGLKAGIGFASGDSVGIAESMKESVDAWQLVSEVLVRPSHMCMNFALPKCLSHMQVLRFSWQVYPVVFGSCTNFVALTFGASVSSCLALRWAHVA